MSELTDGLSDESRFHFMIWGLLRWDPDFVAAKIREGDVLTPLVAKALANLIDGSHPQGYRLSFVGLGRNELTMAEKAERVQRAEKILDLFEAERSSGSTWLAAVVAVSDALDISEATVARELKFFEGLRDVLSRPMTDDLEPGKNLGK